jgi:hypothetical protein
MWRDKILLGYCESDRAAKSRASRGARMRK